MLDSYSLTGAESGSSVYVFADERKIESFDSNWLYFGILFLSGRGARDWFESAESIFERHHLEKPLHLTDVKKENSDRFRLSKELLEYVCASVMEPQPPLRIMVLGIELRRLDRSAFGIDSNDAGIPHARAYTRFFRSAFRSAIGLWWPNRNLQVERIYHDSNGHLQADPWFDTNVNRRVTETDGIEFRTDQIDFVSSDHRKESVLRRRRASRMIQIVDLILGTTTDIFHVGDKRLGRARAKLSDIAFPVVHQSETSGTWTDKNRCGFSYSHFPVSGTVDVSNGTSFRNSEFYQRSTVLFRERSSGQQDLFSTE